MKDTTRAAQTKEPQYQVQFETMGRLGPLEMGPSASYTWRNDPRRLTFLLSRYKFVSKLFAGKRHALEVGCGDGFGMRVVLQTVGAVHGIDFDPMFVDWARAHAQREGLNCTFSTIDITKEPPSQKFDCAYSLDVIEHIEPSEERDYLRGITAALEPHGTCIIGTPNITAQAYASPQSMEGHINLKSAETLKASMDECFENVFIFCMNDEVVHTGYYPMAQYLFAVGAGVRA